MLSLMMMSLCFLWIVHLHLYGLTSVGDLSDYSRAQQLLLSHDHCNWQVCGMSQAIGGPSHIL